MTISTGKELSKAYGKERWWLVARISTGVLLCISGFLAALNGIMGAAAGAWVADGGADNGARGLLIMGLLFAASVGLMPSIWWSFGGRSDNKFIASSGILVGVLSLVGGAIGHFFGGDFWYDWHLTWVVALSGTATIVLILLGWVVVPAYERAAQHAYDLEKGSW